MANLKLRFDEYIPLRDIVFKTLREAIITGQLEPGERLMEIKLANQLGVSRTPVREAIRKLEQEGLVIMTARKGAEVAPINEEDLREVLEIRKTLESLACQLACEHIDNEQLGKIRQLNDVVRNAVEENDIQLIASADIDFHEAIYEATKNKRLIQILHQLKEHIFRYRLEYIKEMKDRSVIVAEHDKIADAISRKAVKEARKEIEHHIEIQEKFILNTLSRE